MWDGGGPPQARPETLLVWRRGATVHHRAIATAALAMLRRAAAPVPLADLCQVFAGAKTGTDDEALVAEAFQIIARWVDDALLTRA